MPESSYSTSSGVTFKLHPLVILNISDHFTRLNSQMNLSVSKAAKGASIVVSSSSPVQPRVYGCIIGVQNGRTIEIFNSFELLSDYDSSSLHRSFLLKKQELYKKVFPDFYILGWYSTGSDIEESDMFLHRSLMDINENPVYLLLNPAMNNATRDLPITIYESEMHIIDGNRRLSFVRSGYTIETVVAETISVNDIAAQRSSDASSAATQCNFPRENSLLRQVLCLLRTLPVTESGRYKDDVLKEYNDTLLIACLEMRTDCLSTIDKIVRKFDRMDGCTDSIASLHG